MRTRTYEELLINRVAKAFESMDNVNAEFFDEILDELVMLFKLKEDMYEQLVKWKEYHETIFQQNLDLARKKVSLLEDEIAQEVTIKYYQTKIDWSYRKDMLESMINIMNEYKLIPFTNPDYASIESVDTDYIPPEIEPEQSEEQPPATPQTQPAPTIPPVTQQAAPPAQTKPKKYVPPSPPTLPKPLYQTNPQQYQPSNEPVEFKPVDSELKQYTQQLQQEEQQIKQMNQQPTKPQKKGFSLFKKM